MLEAGRACLILALAICVYGIGASLYGARAGRRDFVASGRRAVYALAGFASLAKAPPSSSLASCQPSLAER